MFNCNIKTFVETYYEAVVKMVKTQNPDIIAHLDIVEKFNKYNVFFNSNEKWYKDILIPALEIISESESIIELNSKS